MITNTHHTLISTEAKKESADNAGIWNIGNDAVIVNDMYQVLITVSTIVNDVMVSKKMITIIFRDSDLDNENHLIEEILRGKRHSSNLNIYTPPLSYSFDDKLPTEYILTITDNAKVLEWISKKEYEPKLRELITR